MPTKIDSRTITAPLPHRIKRYFVTSTIEHGLGLFVAIFLVSFTGTLGVLLHQTYQDYRKELAAQVVVKERLSYWESVITQYPQFPAAYYEAALHAARLSDTEKAREYIDQALFVDPNFFEAEVFAKELKSR